MREIKIRKKEKETDRRKENKWIDRGKKNVNYKK